MNASIASLVFSTPAGAGVPALATAQTATGNPAQANTGGLFAGLIGGLRTAALTGEIAPAGPLASGPSAALAGKPVRPDGDGGLLAESDAAQMDLLTDIVALAMQVQEAFATAQSPPAKAAILTEFGNSLGLRLAAFDPVLDENALKMAVRNLSVQTIATIEPQATQLGPAAFAKAVLTALGLDDVPTAALAQPVAHAAATSTVAIESGLRSAHGSVPDTAQTARATLPADAQAVRAQPDGLVTALPARAPLRREPTDLFARAPLGGGVVEEALGAGTTAALQSPKSSAGVQPGLLAQQNPFDAVALPRPSVDGGEVAQPQLGRALPGGMESSFLRGLETGVLQGKAGAEVPSSPAFARHLATQVSGALISEGSTRIELTPRGLGDIEIAMRHDEAGKLRVVLKADNPAVLTAFRQDRDLLLGALRESSGGEIAGSDVDLSFESFAGHQSRQRSDQDEWRSVVVGDRTPATEAPPPVGSFASSETTHSSGHGGLDIIT
jgi:flagellar hook-length control protein FliK